MGEYRERVMGESHMYCECTATPSGYNGCTISYTMNVTELKLCNH